jgi:hypothetical protein
MTLRARCSPAIAIAAGLLWLGAAALPAWSAEPASAEAVHGAARRAAALSEAKPKRTAAPAHAAATPAPPRSDRLELSTTEISGNRELPKLMYIVPWRRDAPGGFAGRPPNSLVDEALAPVDREVFERQNRYYEALQDASRAPGGPKPAAAAPAASAPAQAAPVAVPESGAVSATAVPTDSASRPGPAPGAAARGGDEK